jgi:hypothetical protein
MFPSSLPPRASPPFVMAGLDPAILFIRNDRWDQEDGRVKPGHDG